ncbi:hypothetical protein DID80_07120 [Candidatus Marinamargulisbacteria bacterium SCGC AAA071-K20]|nr:hypothetical protein DID80_07120 [Candidatus Marinamargulisbacteria bacterium SCGC AAA071-K20]
MAITKIQSESLNLSDTYDFTGTVTGAGGVNTPAFLAHRSSAQTNLSDNTITKVLFNHEDYDTDNCYDNSTNFRFTPGVTGKYHLYSQIGAYPHENTAQDMTIYIYKNGSDYIQTRQGYSSMVMQNTGTYSLYASATVDVGSISDYFEVFVKINTNGGAGRIDYNASLLYTYFGGYKIIE